MNHTGASTREGTRQLSQSALGLMIDGTSHEYFMSTPNHQPDDNAGR